MKRWEFDSINQAAKCIHTWFPGTLRERYLLEEHLDSMIGMHLELLIEIAYYVLIQYLVFKLLI